MAQNRYHQYICICYHFECMFLGDNRRHKTQCNHVLLPEKNNFLLQKVIVVTCPSLDLINVDSCIDSTIMLMTKNLLAYIIQPNGKIFWNDSDGWLHYIISVVNCFSFLAYLIGLKSMLVLVFLCLLYSSTLLCSSTAYCTYWTKSATSG